MQPLRKSSQIWLTVGSLALIATFYLPIWRIDLWAPQYPEGLSLKIWLSKLSGDVEIINGLNHYIGMAHIKEEMFPEFKFLKYCVAFIIAAGLFTAFSKNQKILIGFLLFLIISGIIALYDFWLWGYRYGHNLSDDAAIKVPGMAYQPPLVGYKQLLNFGAYSVPDIGGWVVVALSVITIGVCFYEFRYNKKRSILTAEI